MKRKIIPIIIAVFCFIAAVCIILYPMVSSYINNKYRSEIHTAYVAQLDLADNSALQKARELAIAYNKAITPGASTSESYSQAALLAAAEDYDSQLDITGNGIMGYIDIPKIDVYLPIYHHTDSETLERGVGHLLGSSLPIGGESTHAILTGHSGMASQKLFTDLPQLKQGDTFYIHVLDEILAYEVDEINTVMPYDTSLLGVTQGEDQCTLVTCTPIGINTHRLLVRGSRIPYEPAEVEANQVPVQEEPVSSNWEEQYLFGILLGVLAALSAALFALLWIKLRRRGKRRKGGRYLCKEKSKPFSRLFP